MEHTDWQSRRLEQAVALFNRRQFFEAHDVLEDIWMEERRSERHFYQGLLHIAVGFYHFDNKNHKGALSQLTKAADKLKDYVPAHRGIQVQQILMETAPFLLAARNRVNGLSAGIQLKKFPQLRYEQTVKENEVTG